MGATEPHMGRTTSANTELLGELAGCETDAAATRLALHRAAESVDSDLSVYVDGELAESTSSEAALVVPVRGRLRGHLVLARGGRPFDESERREIEAIALALSLFQPGQGSDLLDRMTLLVELSAALQTEEIQPYFLPKADLGTARVTGIEALARWLHPERGLLLPADFLSIAEAGGLMDELTERIIAMAIRAAGDWWRSGLRLELSVNLPASALTSPDPGLAETVADTLDNAKLPAKSLRFDLGEDALMGTPDPSRALVRLTELGTSVSIDDFGTGHTSLTRLEGLGIDELKIDRSLIRAMARGGDRALVRSTIHLARQTGVKVVAEGVDTEEVWRQLRGMGCDAAQGFLIGAPMPARDFLAWIASWNTRGRELNTMPREPLKPSKRRARKASHARDQAPA
jgi:EAL domain-containing protein (putative c-di-GMP-specific phosphodiesterase class I)